MNKIYGILLILFLMLDCKEKTTENNKLENIKAFNQDLANELQTMAAIDQIAANNAFPPFDYTHLSQEQWETFKDSVYRTNQKRTKEILDEYGFVGYDLAGEEGSLNFWLIVQHSDHNPQFQNKVLEKMKIEVDRENAESRKYGLLVDRVKLNTGQAQVYGTQVTYNKHTGQAYPRKLFDSINVNKRRKAVGFEPIEIYLNEMSEMHFEMNKKNMLKRGVIEPKLYSTE